MTSQPERSMYDFLTISPGNVGVGFGTIEKTMENIPNRFYICFVFPKKDFSDLNIKLQDTFHVYESKTTFKTTGEAFAYGFVLWNFLFDAFVSKRYTLADLENILTASTNIVNSSFNIDRRTEIESAYAQRLLELDDMAKTEADKIQPSTLNSNIVSIKKNTLN